MGFDEGGGSVGGKMKGSLFFRCYYRRRNSKCSKCSKTHRNLRDQEKTVRRSPSVPQSPMPLARTETPRWLRLAVRATPVAFRNTPPTLPPNKTEK